LPAVSQYPLIPHSQPFLGPEEAAAAQRVVQSGFLAQGPEVEALERELAAFLGVKGAVAVASGTAALHLALKALGVKPSARVHLPTYVCTAVLNAVNLCGACPVLCDVDPETGNIDLHDLKLRMGRTKEPVIVPHLFGAPAAIEEMHNLTPLLIEDCAQSLGASIGGSLTGSIGVLSVFSFYATKVICGGEGGAVASNSEALLDKVRDLREYDNKPDYIPRFNYKMTDLQAAVARVQLKRLPHFIERRRRIAKLYDQALKNTCFRAPKRGGNDIFFRYILFSRQVEETINELAMMGISAARPVFKPLHQYLGLNAYPGAETIFSRALSIPCYPALKDEEVERICAALKSIVEGY